jgi:dTDP-4-dehydrorhamnose 3,5-epimerase
VTFTELSVPGAYLVIPEPRVDPRGSFTRIWDAAEFGARGLDPRVAQCGVSRNARRGTVRGIHYQADPHAQPKVVRCTRGTIFDVVVDLRAGSPAARRWDAVTLTAEGGRMLYVPAGCGHGFQTLEDDTEVLYILSAPHVPAAERGVRWDDPAVGIAWPLVPTVMSPRDRSYPDL